MCRFWLMAAYVNDQGELSLLYQVNHTAQTICSSSFARPSQCAAIPRRLLPPCAAQHSVTHAVHWRSMRVTAPQQASCVHDRCTAVPRCQAHADSAAVTDCCLICRICAKWLPQPMPQRSSVFRQHAAASSPALLTPLPCAALAGTSPSTRRCHRHLRAVSRTNSSQMHTMSVSLIAGGRSILVKDTAHSTMSRSTVHRKPQRMRTCIWQRHGHRLLQLLLVCLCSKKRKGSQHPHSKLSYATES